MSESLKGSVAVVTGASRGVGKGIALGLIEAGATVYITGRTARDLAYIQETGHAIECDHRSDKQTESVFKHVADEQGRLDILVNNVWGGYENMVEDGEFTFTRPFWRQPLWRWDAMFQAGVRAYYVASRFAAPLMIARRSGLIVNVSFWAAQKYVANAAYGVSKAATDKLTSDMAHELREYNVAAVSLYPGLVRTESVLMAGDVFDLSNSESPQFVGRAVAAMAADPDVMAKSGKVVIAAEMGREYGFTDIDGKSPRPLTLDDI